MQQQLPVPTEIGCDAVVPLGKSSDSPPLVSEQPPQLPTVTPVHPGSGSPDDSPQRRSDPSLQDVQELLDQLQGAKKRSQHNEERAALIAKTKACKIMVVDDEEVNVQMIKHHLNRGGYSSILTITDSREAYDTAKRESPDLILLDLKMPHINGLEITRLLKADSNLRDIPVVIVTATSSPKIKAVALQMGVNDFLTKPVDLIELIPRVRNSLLLKLNIEELANQKRDLEQKVQQRTRELYLSRQQIIFSLARAAEHRDNDTGNHVIRVGCFAAIIARQLGWAQEAVDMIQQAAQLHDVGKIGIPDRILFKPDKLDQNEYDIMKKHCALGTRIISPFDKIESQTLRSHTWLGENILHVRDSPLMMMAARIAQTHHEHWNGSGYPLGLAGEDIPIEGRITAVADVFDALSSQRPYKDPIPRERCFQIIEQGRGTQFDPSILDAFFDCSQEIVKIQMALMDN